MNSRVSDAKRLIERSRTAVEKARHNVLRARANNIRAIHLAEKAWSTRYENRLIRGIKR